MEKRKWNALLWLWLMALPLSAKPLVHRNAVDVQISSDYLSVTQILDITPQDADEFRIPVEGKHLHKKCILLVDVIGREGHFERLKWWNPTVSTAEKQYKCGRMWKDADNAELCWGLVPGKRITYYATYPLIQVLYAEQSHDVLDYDFIRLDKQCPAGQAEIKLYLKEGKINPADIDLDHSTADGDIQLQDGVLFITPKAGTKEITTMHVHLAFRPGFFEGIPMRQANGSGSAGNQPSNSQASMVSAVHSPILPDEIHSPMMSDTTPKTESGGLAVVEYAKAYPKTTIFLACLLVVLGGIIFRFIKAAIL